MRFSRRTGWDRTENELAAGAGEARAVHGTLLDLTGSNPTRAGLPVPEDLLAELGHPRGGVYEPEPTGHPRAREAVAAYYAGRGQAVAADRIVLSASTSESYGWLFKLLADPGDELLVPIPSYPLFPFLAGLEGVTLTPFRTFHERGAAGPPLPGRGAGPAGRMGIDFDDLAARIGPRTRALVLVSPNNPTGCFVPYRDRVRVVELAARHGLALVVDEVFGDYAFDPGLRARPPSFAGTGEVLTFVLSGLSKVVALPQVKLGWIAVSGPDGPVREALARLEILADCYLSVATPVQLALPAILGARARLQAPVIARTAAALAELDGALAGAERLHRLPAEGGWYAVLGQDRYADDALAGRLQAEDGVLVHPGFFFDYAEEGRVVVSLLTEPRVLREGVGRIRRRVEGA